MTTFAPRTYQQQVLGSVEAYFAACHGLRSPSVAFTATTERLCGRGNAYHPLSGFPADMPYFCLRVPTGGGKTWLAAKSASLVNTHLLRTEYSVILWLVPSRPIREQTIKALKDRRPPCHAALPEAGPITVLDLEEAKSVSRATLLEARMRGLRRQAVGKAFQQALFGQDATSRVAVTDRYAFEFHAQAYAPSRDYDGRFGHFEFRKHFDGRIAEDDRLIGGLWANLSGGRCRFVMVKDKRWEWIEEKLSSSPVRQD